MQAMLMLVTLRLWCHGEIVFPPCRSKTGIDKSGATESSKWGRMGQPPDLSLR